MVGSSDTVQRKGRSPPQRTSQLKMSITPRVVDPALRQRSAGSIWLELVTWDFICKAKLKGEGGWILFLASLCNSLRKECLLSLARGMAFVDCFRTASYFPSVGQTAPAPPPPILCKCSRPCFRSQEVNRSGPWLLLPVDLICYS